MTIAELIVKIGADASQFARQMEVTKQQVRSVSRAFESFGRKMTVALTVPMAGAAAAALKMSADMEQTGVAFRSMLKDGNASVQMLKDIQRIAAETPFEFPELANSARLLLAYRFEASKVIPMLRTIGDAASAMGAGAEGMDRITRAIGEMQTKGRVTSQEMLQLSEIGINGFQMIAEASGRTTQEIMNLSEKGMLDAATGVSAILSGINRQFGGAMEQQSRTLLGRWSTFLDDAKAAMRQFGDQIAPIAQGALAAVSEAVKAAGDRFAAMNIHEKNATLATYAMIAAIPPMVMMISKLVVAFNALKLAGLATFAVGGPIAIGIIALSGLIYVLTKRWLEHKAALGAFNNDATATVTALNKMTEGQQRLTLAFRQRLLAQYEEERRHTYNFEPRARTLDILIDQNKKEIKAIQDAINARVSIPSGGQPVGVPALPGEKMTPAQERYAQERFQQLQYEARMEYFRNRGEKMRRQLGPRMPTPRGIPEQLQIQELAAQKMDANGAMAERYQSQFQGYVASFTNWTNGFLEIGDRMGNVAASIAMNWKNAGQIITNALQQMTAQLIAAITKALVFKALMKMFGIPTDASGGVTFGGIIKSALGFAEGGIVTKPTLAVLAEKNEPEAVIPLSKMVQFGNGRQTINIILDGRTMASALTDRQSREVRMRGVLAA